MRELKNGMKKFFAAIFCLFMNLIPRKKFTMSNNLKETTGLIAGTGGKQASINEMVKMCATGNGEFAGRYICYLKDVLKVLDSQKYSQRYLKKGYCVNLYMDTG